MKKLIFAFTIPFLLFGCTFIVSDKDVKTCPSMDMQNMDHSMMNMDMPSADPSSKAFFEANMKMHKDMNISFSGDADIDFVTGMIPHHQGAIDMAQIVLKYGKNEEIKTLAQNIIKAQQEEIAFMQNWFTGSQQQ